jgi:hypothetical protein
VAGPDAWSEFSADDIDYRAVADGVDDPGPIRDRDTLRDYAQDWLDTAGNEFAVAEGAVLPGEDERVQRCPDRFVALGTPDEEVRRLKAEAAVPPPPPEPLGRVKLRVLPGQGGLSAIDGGRPQTVFANGREYSSGETLEAEGTDAQHLIDVGACEVVRHLRRKKQTRH